MDLRKYARNEISKRRLWAANVLQRAVRVWFAKKLLYRMKKKQNDQTARLRRFMLHVTHGTLLRVYTAWAGESKRMNRLKFMIGKAKNSKAQRFLTRGGRMPLLCVEDES